MALQDEPRAPFLSEDGPWTGQALVRMVGLSTASLAGITASWAGASDELAFREQLPWLLLGLLAISLSLYAAVGWLAQGARLVRAQHRDLHLRLRALIAESMAPVSGSLDAWVQASGMTHAHRPDCQLVRGKDVTPVATNNPSKLCGMCS